MYLAEIEPLPLCAIPTYLLEKHKQKTQFENYIADCLWATATGRTFNDKEGKPTLQQWKKIAYPGQKKSIDKKITKNEVKMNFLRLKNTEDK